MKIIRIILIAACSVVVLLATSCDTQKAEAGSLQAKEQKQDKKESKKNSGCNSDDTKHIINPNNKDFPKEMDKCASKAWGDEKETIACLKKTYAKLSDGCVTCFGKVAACSKAHCKAKCMFNHFSDGCLNCVETNCRDDKKGNDFSLVKCTGLQPAQLPPRK